MNTKKIISLIMAAVMVFGLCACDLRKDKTDTSVVLQSTPEPTITESDFERLPDDDPVYAETEDMFACVAKFIEYNQVLNNSIDYMNISAEDYWNIVAIVVAAYPQISDYASTDVVGSYHIKTEYAEDFANAFIYEYLRTNEAPGYSDSYAASTDPGTGIVDLMPIGVNNYSGVLEGIEAADSHEDYDYIMHLTLCANNEADPDVHYHVYLCSWDLYFEDDAALSSNHILPYMVYGFEQVEQTGVSDGQLTEDVKQTEAGAQTSESAIQSGELKAK